MADQIRFYRAANGSTLPSISDGTIFVVTSDLIVDESGAKQYYGDMYVDISDNERLHIRPSDGVYYLSRAKWDEHTEDSKTGKPYFLIDRQSDGNTSYSVPKVGIGDGSTKVKDLSLYSMVSNVQEQKWNNKVDITTTASSLGGSDCYRLIFSKG